MSYRTITKYFSSTWLVLFVDDTVIFARLTTGFMRCKTVKNIQFMKQDTLHIVQYNTQYTVRF